MKKRVILQRRGTTRQATGQQSETWTNVYTTGGLVRSMSSSETLNQRRDVASQSYSVTIPYSAMGLTLTTSDAASIGGVRYQIDGIDTETHFRKSIVLTVVSRNGRA